MNCVAEWFKHLSSQMRHNPLWSNTADLGALQAVGYLLPLLSMPYLVRVIGTAHYGLYALVLAVISYFGVFADFGFGYTAVRLVAAKRGDESSLRDTVSSIIVAKSLLGIVSCAALVACSYLLPLSSQMRQLLRLASPLLVLGSVNPSWYFQGLQRMRAIVGWQIVVRFAGLILLFALVRRRNDLPQAILVELAVASAAALGGWLLLARKAPIGLTWPTRGALQSVVREAAQLFASSLAIVLYTHALPLILGVAASREQVAYFAIAERISNAGKRLLAPFLLALTPHVNRIRASNPDAALGLLRGVFRKTLAVGSTGTALLIVLSPLLVWMISGNARSPAIGALLAMSPQALLVAISNILGVQALFSFGVIRPVVKVQIVVGLLALVPAYIAATRFGAVGVAFVGTAAEGVIASLFYVVSRKHLDFP